MDTRRAVAGILGLVLVGAVAVALAGAAAGLTATGDATADGEGTMSTVTMVDSNDSTLSPYLSPPADAVTREEYTPAGIDVSAAAAADGERLVGAHREQVFTTAFEAADSEERATIVAETAVALEERTDAIHASHGHVIERYSSGEYPATRLLREHVRLEASASQEADFAEVIATAVAGDTDVALPPQVEALLIQTEYELPVLDAPVSQGVRDGSLPGGGSIYIQATDDGVVLGAPGDTFTRQATLRSERNRSADNRFFLEGGTHGDALIRSEELYPGLQGFLPPPDDNTNVYTIQGESAHGTFEAYLDGWTQNVFHEVQSIQSNAVPTTETYSVEEAGITVTVATTNATGPMRVTVTEDGGSVADAELAVGESSIGTTDATGHRWVVQPRGSFSVSATVGEETVTVAVGENGVGDGLTE